MLVDKMLPAINKKWPHSDRHMYIMIQQDYTSPHVSNKDEEVVACCKEGDWSISMRRQPAKSPDSNALDLGFFNRIYLRR
ncbi:TPA: hypothetical protein N0F65_000874 [Lagenidium giganteum]|uniref:Transposase n=1 Tax=Lagenidium giganteum TaxID=4803 RepID=A0AAV2Z2I0_9STRA|nr:TPA: hypothetical protein N0F65_000874 [Lagenidium giganteum]